MGLFNFDFCCPLWTYLGPLVPVNHYLSITANLSIVADCVHIFMTTESPFSNGCFKQNNTPGHKVHIVSSRFLEHVSQFAVLKWPSQSLDFNPIEHLWYLAEREICIWLCSRQICAIMSTWKKILEECFQLLVERMPQRSRAVLNLKRWWSGTSKAD